MTKHKAFKDIDINTEGLAQVRMRTCLYSQKLSEIYNMRFSYVCNLICLTEGGRKVFFNEKRTVYLPFIINDVEVSMRPLKYGLNI